MIKRKLALILSLAISLCCFVSAHGEDKSIPTLFVPVYQVVDARFAALDEKEIKIIFDEAKILLKDKFGVDGEFEYKGPITRERYNENFYYPYKPPAFTEGAKDGDKIWKWKII